MNIKLNYPSSPASLFSMHAREGVIYEGVTCPYCLNTEVEAVGGYFSDGKTIRIYFCQKCNSNFERTVGDVSDY